VLETDLLEPLVLKEPLAPLVRKVIQVRLVQLDLPAINTALKQQQVSREIL
jgi:hypothetical protein